MQVADPASRAQRQGSFDADVAIIGYGPTGVSAANFLGSYGVKAIALERERDIYQRARAVTVNDWTLRCYQSVGLAAELLRNMDVTYALRWRTYAGQELVRTRFRESKMGHPNSTAIYQPVMEQTLREGAQRYAEHVEVRFGQEMQGITQDADGVTITVLDRSSSAVNSIRVRYALACDGGASRTRTELGVKLVGTTLEQLWVIIDARVKRWWPERHILTFWSDRKRPVVDIALSLGNHRWEFPLGPQESEADFTTHEQLWKLLGTLGVTPDMIDIHQHAFYRHHTRHAERWRVGRVFLLGDAAHLMPPWAGQGMQSGIRDTFNISWKLREVLAGRLPDSILDSFETERAPNVAFLTALSEQLGRIIKMQMTGREKAMAMVGKLLGKLGVAPPESPLMRTPVLGAGWLRGADSKGAVGRMPPQPRVATSQGKLCLLDDMLGNGFSLLGDGVNPRTLLTPEEKTGWDALGARYFAVRQPDQAGAEATDIIDLEGSLQRWMRSFNTRAIAMRPDRFVAAAEGSGLAVPESAVTSLEK